MERIKHERWSAFRLFIAVIAMKLDWTLHRLKIESMSGERPPQSPPCSHDVCRCVCGRRFCSAASSAELRAWTAPLTSESTPQLPRRIKHVGLSGSVGRMKAMKLINPAEHVTVRAERSGDWPATWQRMFLHIGDFLQRRTLMVS